MSTITINGVGLSPSEMTITLQDISAADSGRLQDTTMYKARIGQKYKIALSWWGPDPATVATVMQAVQPEYFSVSFPDPLTNTTKTKTFYCGDRAIPVKWWNSNNKRYSKLSFNIIER